MNNKWYLRILVLILAILLVFNCNSDKLIDAFKNEPKIDTVITIKSDTIWPDTVFNNIYVGIPGPSTTYTVYSSDSIPAFINVYSDTLRDSNIVISYTDSISGTLLGKKLDYKLLVPLMIRDSIFVNITETKTLDPIRKLFFGVNAQVYPLEPHISPILTYQDRRDRMYHVQYDIITGGASVGFSTKLKNPFKRK